MSDSEDEIIIADKVKEAVAQWKKVDIIKRAILKQKRDYNEKINKLIKVQNDKLSELSPIITDFFKKNGVLSMEFKGGSTIKLHEMDKKKPYSTGMIKHALTDIIEKNEDIEKILKAIDESRVVTKITAIKSHIRKKTTLPPEQPPN